MQTYQGKVIGFLLKPDVINKKKIILFILLTFRSPADVRKSHETFFRENAYGKSSVGH